MARNGFGRPGALSNPISRLRPKGFFKSTTLFSIFQKLRTPDLGLPWKGPWKLDLGGWDSFHIFERYKANAWKFVELRHKEASRYGAKSLPGPRPESRVLSFWEFPVTRLILDPFLQKREYETNLKKIKRRGAYM